MEDKKQKIIRKEDLNLLAVQLMDLKFNRGGDDLICSYIEKKLKEDGVEIDLDVISEKGEFNGFVVDYSMRSKRGGIKEMSREIVMIGEERGLSGETPLGVWINHSVECMGLKIIEDVLKSVDEVLRVRRVNLWNLYSYKTPVELQEEFMIDALEVDKMFERMFRNIKHIKFEEFKKLNKFVY